MIKGNHIVIKRLRFRWIPGTSEHNGGTTIRRFAYYSLCDKYTKRRKPCKPCLRIAAQIAEDAKRLEEK